MRESIPFCFIITLLEEAKHSGNGSFIFVYICYLADLFLLTNLVILGNTTVSISPSTTAFKATTPAVFALHKLQDGSSIPLQMLPNYSCWQRCKDWQSYFTIDLSVELTDLQQGLLVMSLYLLCCKFFFKMQGLTKLHNNTQSSVLLWNWHLWIACMYMYNSGLVHSRFLMSFK